MEGVIDAAESQVASPEVKEEARAVSEAAEAESASKSKPRAKTKSHKTPAPKARSAPKARRAAREASMAARKKIKNGEEKVGMAVSVPVAKMIRKLRAQYELETGDRPTISETIARGLKSAIGKR